MKTSEKPSFPPSVRACLWSYDLGSLDMHTHQNLIITQTLNSGSKEATDWIQAHYTQQEVRAAIQHPLPGMWNKKSLNFWSIVYNIQPEQTKRRVS